MGALIQVFKADFRERTRGYTFLALIAVTIYLTYLFVPPVDANYLTVALGNRRGIYNAAWVGTMFGLAATVLLSLVAFYVIKNALDRDEHTGVGVLFSASPTRTWQYLLGKWLSNLAVLSVLLGVLSIMGMVTQQLRGEATGIDIRSLLTPIWLMGFPVMAIVAGVAIIFECVPVLRDSRGNVVYFFLWIAVLSFSITTGFSEGTFMRPTNDLFGISVPVSHMQRQVLESDPSYNGDFSIGRSGFDEVRLFTWEGASWPPAIILGRLVWTILGAVIAIAGAIPFKRFDPARHKPVDIHHGSEWRQWIVDRLIAPLQRAWWKLAGLVERAVKPVAQIIRSEPTGSVFLAELRLNLGGQPWWWVVGLIVLLLVSFTRSDKQALAEVLHFAWIWPILIWSQLGVRESRYFTEPLIFSTPRPLRRQLPAMWLGGVAVALIAASGVLGRLIFSGDISSILVVLVGAMFIPALAFALGVWSGTSRLFELVYLLWWYLLVNGARSLNFMGLNEEALSLGLPFIYLGLTGILLLLGVIGRMRQINRL